MDNPQTPVGTQPETTTKGRLDEASLQRLNAARQSSAGVRADGYLGLMLIGGEGWSASRTAEFLGIDQQSLQRWHETFHGTNRNVNALRDVADPIRSTYGNFASPGG